MKKNKTFAVYISLKEINGILFPSYIQNQLCKNFIEKNLNSKIHMSQNENMYNENLIVLNSLIKEKNFINGIVTTSIFFLPRNKGERLDIFKKSIKNKKKIYFLLENLCLENKENIEEIENNYIFTNEFFTDQKNQLNDFEIKYCLNNKWSFV